MPFGANGVYTQDGAGVGSGQGTEGPLPLAAGANAVGKVGPGYTSAQTPITASSGNVAAGAAVATLAAAAGKTTYITGFTVNGSGSTTALPVTVAVTNTITGTLSYTFTFIAGVLLACTPLNVMFPVPIPANAVNTAIVVTVPTGGTGNTNTTVSAYGYQE